MSDGHTHSTHPYEPLVQYASIAMCKTRSCGAEGGFDACFFPNDWEGNDVRRDDHGRKVHPTHHLLIGWSIVERSRFCYEAEKKGMMKSSRKHHASVGAPLRSILFCFLAVLISKSDAFNANRPTLRPVAPFSSSSRAALTSYRKVQSSPATVLRANDDVCVDVVSS